ncbi:MAG: hypothetical protein KGS47_03485 [Chloroflexi bacterium]|nr:hypothetical protein [Chloroflexota bacterium]
MRTMTRRVLITLLLCIVGAAALALAFGSGMRYGAGMAGGAAPGWAQPAPDDGPPPDRGWRDERGPGPDAMMRGWRGHGMPPGILPLMFGGRLLGGLLQLGILVLAVVGAVHLARRWRQPSPPTAPPATVGE